MTKIKERYFVFILVFLNGLFLFLLSIWTVKKFIENYNYHDIWICSHNLQSYDTDTEINLCRGSELTFKLCQDVALPLEIASVGKPLWIQEKRQVFFPNRYEWITYGNTKHRKKNKINSMALGIYVNSGFTPESFTSIPINTRDQKSIVIVHGKFQGSNTPFTIANIHGSWDGNNHDARNVFAITWFLHYMKYYISKYGGHFVLAGDYSLNYYTLKEHRVYFDAIIPNLRYPTLRYFLSRNLTSEGNHMICNVDVVELATLVGEQFSDLIPLKFKIRLPYAVKTDFASVHFQPSYFNISNYVKEL